MMRLVGLAMVLVMIGCGAASPAPLRLRRVVLYRNGVGYFEQSGRHGREALTLRFRRREIDDVLQTLTVVDDGGSNESLAAVLPQEARESGEDDALVGIDLQLGRARGRRLTVGYAVPTPTWVPAYRIVLPDARGPGEGLLQGWALVHNVSGEDWRDVNLTLAAGGPLSFAMDMRTPRFVPRPDATAALGAPVVLGVVRSESSQTTDHDADGIADTMDRCPDEIESYNGYDDEDGCPDRGMVVVTEENLQILEHIYFEEGSSEIRGAADPIVDALVATLRGNPHIRRVEVRGHASDDERNAWVISAARAASLRARLIALGVEADRLEAVPLGTTQPIDPRHDANARQRNRRAELHIVETDGSQAAPPTGAISVASLERSSRGAATAVAASDGTRYPLASAVSIPAGTSTLVSILQRRIAAEDVLLYRPDPNVPESETHPFRAARLENGSGTDLVGGPVALFASGSFVGQGLMDDLHDREHGFVPYAVDRAAVVHVDGSEQSEPLRMVSVARGVLTVLDAAIVRTTYSISPGSHSPARIFVRHAVRAGYAPTSLPPDAMPTPDAWLVPVRMTPGRTSVLTVEERKPVRRTLALAEIGGSSPIALYVERADLDEDTERSLLHVVELRALLGRAQEAETEVRGRINDLAQRTAELRENLLATDRAAGPAAALRRQLLAQLARADGEMADLSAQLATVRATQLDARTRLADAIRDLTVAPEGSPAAP